MGSAARVTVRSPLECDDGYSGGNVRVTPTSKTGSVSEWSFGDEAHYDAGMLSRTPSRRTGFTLVEIMVVAAIVGILAAAGGVGIAESVRKGQARDDAEAISNGIRMLRSQAARKGLAAAMQVTNAGSTVQFAVVSPTTGCTDFIANPLTASDVSTVRLQQSTARLAQNGAADAVCFSQQNFFPTQPGIGVPVALNIALDDKVTSEPLLALDVAQVGTIHVDGETFFEGRAVTAVRIPSGADQTSADAVLPTTAPQVAPEQNAAPSEPAMTSLDPAAVPPPAPPADTSPPPLGSTAIAPDPIMPLAPLPVEPPPVVAAPPPDPPPSGGGGGGGGGGCFVAGTPVLTVTGLRPIESIAVGDVVWSRDGGIGGEGFQPVVHTFIHEGHPVLNVHLLGDDAAEVITATAEHPWYVQSVGWVGTSELLVGDVIATANGGSVVVEAIDATEVVTTVYNFEVEGTHTYFVGTLNALVHNLKQAMEMALQ